MRLTAKEHHAIKKYFFEVFKEGKIYLFGSRVDDNRKGGDIDLYLQIKDTKSLVSKKLDFLVKLKREIGQQKIDVVFDKNLNRAIDRVAINEGVVL